MLTESKYTPGPWKVTTDRHGRPTMVFSVSRGKGVAKTAWDGYAEQSDKEAAEEAANARLIAAAPDLLEALKKLLESEDLDIYPSSIECGYEFDAEKWAEAARAVVAKAEGRA